MVAHERTQEGEVAFHIPEVDKPCHTWYKIYGDLASEAIPLLILHGGPGACHEYLLPLADLTKRFKVPVIFYDQIGNGRSTRLREKAGDEKFWTVDLFQREIDNLVDHLGIRERGFDLYGQSWGGMLGAEYAAGQPKGLRRLILSNSPASVELMLVGTGKLRAQLPDDVRRTLDECEKHQDFDSEEYEQACQVFYDRHICRIHPYPALVQVALEHLKDDPTVYGTMFGPSELSPIGNLKSWTVIPRISDITVSTLLINGRYDEVQDVSVVPFFENLKKVKWNTLENSSHMSHFEERERYIEIVASFLQAAD